MGDLPDPAPDGEHEPENRSLSGTSLGEESAADVAIGEAVHEGTGIAANTFYLTSADLMSKVASIALYLVMARRLGDSSFGVYTFALSFAQVVTALGTFGQTTVLVREVSRQRALVHRYFLNTLGIMSALAVPLMFGSVLVLAALGTNRTTVLTVLILGVGVCFDLLTSGVFSTFEAFERFSLVPLIVIPQRFFTAILGIFALLLGAGVIPVATIYLCGSVLAFALSWTLLHRKVVRPHLHLDVGAWVPLMRAAAPLGMAGVFFTILFRIDMTLLAAFEPAGVVGNYAAAYRMLDATLFLSWSVTGAVYPVMSRLTRHTSPSIGEIFSQALKLVVVLTLPLAVGAAILSEDIIRTIYGAGFPDAGRALLFLAPTIALYPPSFLAGYLLVSQDRQRVVTAGYGLVALENVVANLLFIPRWSLQAAAVGTSVSQALILAIFVGVIVKDRVADPVHWSAALIAPVTASAAAAVAMAALRESLPTAIAVAGVVYLIAVAGVERLLPPHARMSRLLQPTSRQR
jgi:O-antigen/teichoic acid export membrane protein